MTRVSELRKFVKKKHAAVRERDLAQAREYYRRRQAKYEDV